MLREAQEGCGAVLLSLLLGQAHNGAAVQWLCRYSRRGSREIWRSGVWAQRRRGAAALKSSGLEVLRRRVGHCGALAQQWRSTPAKWRFGAEDLRRRGAEVVLWCQLTAMPQ